MLKKGYNIDALEEVTIKTFYSAVGGIAKAAHSEWVRLAQEQLTTTRADYINGLRQAESFKMTSSGDKKTFELTLVGRMPNNYEFGLAAFDMKSVRPGWLGGGKAQTAKDGHSFIRIPFRHSKSSSARLGYTGKAKRANLRKHLNETVKSFGLDKMVRSSTGKIRTGVVARIPNSATGIHPYLRGLTRIQQRSGGSPISSVASGSKPRKERGQGILMTWRVMSEKSPAESWIHPGIRAAKLMPQVESWIKNEIIRVVDKILG